MFFFARFTIFNVYNMCDESNINTERAYKLPTNGKHDVITSRINLHLPCKYAAIINSQSSYSGISISLLHLVKHTYLGKHMLMLMLLQALQIVIGYKSIKAI